MLKDKGLLVVEIDNIYKNWSKSMGKRYLTSYIQDKCRNIKENHNIPVNVSMEIITGNIEPNSYSEFVLFCIAQELDDSVVNLFFTKKEIEKYSKEKIKNDTVKMPLKLTAIQISSDQWISSVSFKELMDWRDAQLIIYNTGTQRIMEKKINNDTEYYEIAINKTAVKNIKESILKGVYIPDTLTFNVLPEYGEVSYDEKTLSLIIDSERGIDITDGYHRYLAISQIYDGNQSLDGKMEIRITNFSESKARQFIWQEDQKTKMKKVLSDSFNQYDNGNVVAQRLNEDPMFDLQGQINAAKGIINLPDFAMVVNKLYFPKKEKSDKQTLFAAIKELKSKINSIYEDNIGLFSNTISSKILILLIYSCKYGENSCETFNFLMDKTKDISDDLFMLPIKLKVHRLLCSAIKDDLNV